MAKCPNRNRKKRLANGRGKCGCQGVLQLKILCPLVFATNRWPKFMNPEDVFSRALFANVRQHGRRIAAREILAAISAGRWNLVCPACGWCLKAPTPQRGC